MERIGKYAVVRQLGRGATSTVWLCRDAFARRDVAVKLLDREAPGDERRARVLQRLVDNEARLAGRLQHPHIAQIHDAVVTPEQSYIVMEYVPGGTLEQFCRVDALLALDRLVEIIFKCSRALGFACRLGVIHRDIKPANILLADSASAGAEIKISDFGMSISHGGDQTQLIGVGSPAYMSPEQVRSEVLNHQTDIYSLGVVMYQLLTGRLPFHAHDSYGVVWQIAHTDPPPPTRLRADLPVELDAIVLRALAKSRSDRYPSWDAFAQDLALAFQKRRAGAAHRRALPESERFTTLRGLSFFADFSDSDIWEVVRFSRWHDVAAGTVVLRQGDEGGHFCVLVDGKVDVIRHGRPVASLAGGEVFGEMAVVSRSLPRRGADVVARSASRVITIPGEALELASETCRAHFYRGFLEVLARRLAETTGRLAGE